MASARRLLSKFVAKTAGIASARSIRYFEMLGSKVLREWSKCHFDEKSLPTVASDILREFRPCDHVTTDEIIWSVLTSDSLPPQEYLDSEFGQPPVTVYWHSRFYVEALFWTTATTAIHQHAFAGAFSVLTGKSVQSKYRFEEDCRINAHFRIGRAQLESLEILQPGDVEPIAAGGALTHSVFHLGMPSVTIVVRTRSDTAVRYQTTLLPPTLAVDPFVQDPTVRRQVQLLQLLQKTKSAHYFPALFALLRRSDPHVAFQVLQECRPLLKASNQWSRTFVDEAPHLARYAQVFEQALEAQERAAMIVGVRKTIQQAELRFMLALILHLPDRDRVLDVIAKEYPARPPIDQLADWIAMSRHALDPRSLPRMDLDKVVVPLLLRGVTDSDIVAKCQPFDGEAVRTYCNELRRSTVLGRLFVAP
jgi:hypothetical protein